MYSEAIDRAFYGHNVHTLICSLFSRVVEWPCCSAPALEVLTSPDQQRIWVGGNITRLVACHTWYCGSWPVLL